jgi:hypothetical protein
MRQPGVYTHVNTKEIGMHTVRCGQVRILCYLQNLCCLLLREYDKVPESCFL